MTLSRRSVLAGVFALVSLPALSACTAAPEEIARPLTDPRSSTAPRPRVLLAFFSRAGENHHYGGRKNLEVGNTAVLASMIADRIGCDFDEIHAATPYAEDYDATVKRNVEEQNSNARPEIAGTPPDITAYDTILLASPIWNVRPPMIMRTYAESLDFTGKTINPIVTFAVSGWGTAAQDYIAACPGAKVGEVLAVRGEEVADAGPDIDAWLTNSGIINR